MALFLSVLWLSLYYTSSLALTTSEKRALLDLHNEFRDRVAGGGLISEGHPAATDMNQLIWDEGLAKLAQNWVNGCQYKHNPNTGAEMKAIRDSNPQGTKWDERNGKKMSDGTIWVGENLAANSNPYTIQRAKQQIEVGWFNEYQSWTYGPAGLDCTRTYCSHYTQMVWANTRYVGCAWVNNCPTNGKNILACNYFPLGNMNSKSTPPYTKASRASKKATNCMSDRTIHGDAQYDNVVVYSAGQYENKYNGLCGGGACATQCAGDSWHRNSCDECSTATDCNDGTSSRTSGRDRCGNSPTQAAPVPVEMYCPDASKPWGCKDGSKCIPADWYCDGTYTDCPDRSDENDCSGMYIMDCNQGDNVCMAAHDTNDTQFIFSASAAEYEWQVNGCHNGKPVYYAEGYVLWYEERYINDTKDDEEYAFWVIRGDEEYAYCNEYDLNECSAGLWHKWIERPGFIGYEIDDKMATIECLVVAKNNSNINSKRTQVVVFSVLLLVFGVIGCIACHRLRNTKQKNIVDDHDHGDTKKLAQHDEMQEVDGTQMLEEIEVEVEMLQDTEDGN